MLQTLSHIPGTQRGPYSSEVQQSTEKCDNVTVKVHKGPLTLLSVWSGFLNDRVLKLNATEGLESSRLCLHLVGDLPKQ